MASQYVGLDIGSASVKAVRMSLHRHEIKLLNIASTPILPHEIEDHEQVVSEAIKKVLSKVRVRRAALITSLAGKGTIIRYHHLPPVPAWRMQVFMDLELEQFKEQSTETMASDFRLMSVIEDEDIGTIAIIGHAREEMISETMQYMASADAYTEEFDLAPMALFNTFRESCEFPDELCALVDIGAENAHIVIHKNGDLYFARSLAGQGGNRYRDVLAERLGIKKDEAEIAKRAKFGLVYDGDEPENIKATRELQKVASSLCVAIEASMKFCRMQNKISGLRLERICITGGGAAIPGMLEYVSKRMNLPTSEYDPILNVDISKLNNDGVATLKNNRGRFSLAIGLAISRLRSGDMRFSLLPESVREHREFMKHGAFLIYAAIAFIIGVCLYVYSPLEMATDRLKTRKALELSIQQGRQLYKKFYKIEGKNKRLYAEKMTLETRVFSGRDIIQCIEALSKTTPKQVWLQTITTTNPFPAERERARKSLPDDGVLYVQGYTVSSVNAADAGQLFSQYLEQLTTVEILTHLDGSSEVLMPKISTDKPIASNNEKYKGSKTTLFSGVDDEGAVDNETTPEHIAFNANLFNDEYREELLHAKKHIRFFTIRLTMNRKR